MDPIPFLDLITPHTELEEELVAVFRQALRTARFIGGPEVEGFEKDWAEFCNVEHAVGVGSGTDALRFALMAAGIGRGDIVVTVPNTFIATTEAISQAGAGIEFVDIDESTYNMDPEKLREYLERRRGAPVKAVIPVHLYGQMADMDPILALARRHRLVVIEDACQAHGAEYFSKKQGRWFKAGVMGNAAAFSFYPGKNLGACGEAGAVTTNDREIARKVRMLRDHGQARKYYHDMEGYNGRMDAIQAGILRVKLQYLADWNARRRQAADRYRELLSKVEGLVVPHEPEWSRAVFHLYIVRIADRAWRIRCLASAGIHTGLHYPVPLHLQNAYSFRNYKKSDFPVTERVAAELLSLPMFPQLTAGQQLQVSNTLGEKFAAVSLQAGRAIPAPSP
jgi:dTDP-4-amino-4,6-dideoxygalactose transaminase